VSTYLYLTRYASFNARPHEINQAQQKQMVDLCVSVEPGCGRLLARMESGLASGKYANQTNVRAEPGFPPPEDKETVSWIDESSPIYEYGLMQPELLLHFEGALAAWVNQSLSMPPSQFISYFKNFKESKHFKV
jgi:hypothetical protein